MNIEYRLARGTAVCRLCEGILEKDKDAAIFIQARNRRAGQVILCPACVRKMAKLVQG